MDNKPITSEQQLQVVAHTALNYPALCEYGYQLKSAVALVVPNSSDVYSVISRLGAGKQVINGHTPEQKAMELLETTSISPIVVQVSSVTKLTVAAENRLRMLLEAAEISQVGNTKLQTLIVFVCANSVPAELQDKLLTIYLEDPLDSSAPLIDPDTLSSFEVDLKLIDEAVKAIDDSDPRTRALKLSLEMSDRFFHFDGIHDLQNVAEAIVERSDDNTDGKSIVPMFLDAFYGYIEALPKDQFQRLPEIESRILERKEEFIFFDNEDIYIADSLFKEIAAPVNRFFSLPVIKKALQESEILLGDRNKGVTKMSCISIDESNIKTAKRVRMVRLQSDRLTKPGSLGIIDILEGGV